jgi:predicted DNA-binding transcriptional regulator AlpA
MGRRKKDPHELVAPVTSKKQLLDITAVCTFLGGIGRDALASLRDDQDERFPKPLQIFGNSPMWSVEQIERYVTRKTEDVEGRKTGGRKTA